MKTTSYLIWSFTIIFLLSCTSKPKVIKPLPTSNADVTAGATDQVVYPKNELHKVKVIDYLHASRYTYLNVAENDNDFWIAIPYTEVEKGQTYYYQGGVLMHNFESKEHNRIFEALYLVSAVSTSPDLDILEKIPTPDPHSNTTLNTKIEQPENGIPLSELLENAENYKGETVVIKGQCVKLNRNIMGKNWIHLQDGTEDANGKKYDLTISTLEEVPPGHIVTFEGKISTNKDFGAGYVYALIMEEAIIK